MAVRRYVLDNELMLGEYVPKTQAANVQYPRAAFDTNLVQVAGWCPCAHYSADVEAGAARLVFALPDGTGRMEILAKPGEAVSAVGATLKTVGAIVPEPPFRLSVTADGNKFSVLVTKDGRTTYHARGVKAVDLDWRQKSVFGTAKFFVDVVCGRVTRASSALTAGFGQADVRFVTTGRDKRLYFENGRVFFTFSARGPETLGVASFDPSRFDVRLEGTVLFDAGDGLLRGDHPADLFYDEEAQEWRAWVCNFSTAGTVNGIGGREKGGVNYAWSKHSPLHGLTVMQERNMDLDGMNEDPTGFYDAAAGKWRVFLSEFTPKGIRGSLWESDAWNGPFSRVTPPTKEDSTGQCLVEIGGRRWAIAGSADQACHVYEYPSLKLHGDIRFDQPPWDAECPNGRVWGTLAVLPDGYAYKYLFLTMDRANFPGIPTPNWTYGALYLYGAQETASAAFSWQVDLDVGNVATNVPLGAGKFSLLEIPKSEFAHPNGVKTATLLFDGTWWHLECEGHIDEDSVCAPLDHPAAPFPAGTRHFEKNELGDLQGWRPAGHNATLGDVAGIWYKGRLHVFYLADRRHHGSKAGAGGHFFAHVSTADLKTWKEHEPAVPLTEWWQTVGTGTPFVLKDGRLALAYGFHTERMDKELAKGKPVGATYAISNDDGETFEPTGRFFHSTRNPTVFNRPDGRYGMVTGYHNEGGVYVSDDLEKWTLVDDTTGKGGDCPCLFSWNGHHYLIQGYIGDERFLHSTTGKPGSWEDWSKDIPALYAGLVVPMVVEIPGNRRLLMGWRPDRGPKGLLWGGAMEIRELEQASDGRLRSVPLTNMKGKMK